MRGQLKIFCKMGSELGRVEKLVLNVIRVVFTFLFIIMSIILIIMLLMKLTEHSPTEMTLFSTGFSILAGFLLMVTTILFNMKEDLGGLKEFKRQTVNKINDINSKIDEILKRLKR